MKAWLAVASADHVARGRAEGFMQVCHGRAGPLRRIRPGDPVAYYSPTRVFRDRTPLRAFKAIGRVAPAEPYRVEMSATFRPWRRDVAWLDGAEVPLAALRGELALTAERNWGYGLRLGLVEIMPADWAAIAAAMEADPPAALG